ncbi:molybdate ABC transporter substrate-binding protein [Thalassotalea litorea]|uniref:Molybdate ABC transporter substrate-binding protein n=1 Tax=Thalassotalea litorea TaxID=2020715 RepID=A0A5R9IMU8_9GAMM|nr:molybdate ABC transporter substrate-binding protein [Thalassotalea litorea]TLU66855.1 molybdate ABC transporter substrate-binding protein [Thalassotalea litorea]
MVNISRSLLIILTLIGSTVASAEQMQTTLKIGVAANFAEPLRRLVTAYNQQNDHKIDAKISVAATGVLYQQVRHGAPFDLVFSADKKRPMLMEDEGFALENSRFTYAIGQLALWSATNPKTALDALQNHPGKIAIAAPHLAPYGKAAREALVSLGLWRKYHRQVITANNISQTYQQTRTGAVEFGIISHSQLLLSDIGSGVLIDRNLHEPIEQQMIILNSCKDVELARDFQRFILSDSSQKFIIEMGYADPETPIDEQQ